MDRPQIIDDPRPATPSEPILRVAPPPPPAPPVPTAVAVAAEVAIAEPDTDVPGEGYLDTLLHAVRNGDYALIDKPLVMGAASEAWAALCTAIENYDWEGAYARAREILALFVEKARGIAQSRDLSGVGGALGRTGSFARGAITVRPQPRAPKPPKVEQPARVRTIRIGKTAELKRPRVPSGPSLLSRIVGRVRLGRVITRGVIPGLLAAAVIAAPAEMVRMVGSEVGTALAGLEQRIRASLEPGLARATFPVPPLEDYGATFETQAEFPKAGPNVTVEWVVALRNSGTAGWYRGVDGAQASLAFADGTTAAVQTTDYVGPGQVGWFVVKLHTPTESGLYRVPLKPQIDGLGPMPDLGIYAEVDVSATP